jgi:glycosyltransferase involved in cell wall biosynthesis
MINGKRVSLIFPAYNEEKNIKKAVISFKKITQIDEVIVINNNSSDNTGKIAEECGARVILEKKQGYGYALVRGLKEAKGEYIMLCEPDGTFSPKDAKKLLSYCELFDVVLGSRTHLSFIEKGANMYGLLRIANIVLAKVIQLLYIPPVALTDCGCTYRVMKKSVVKKILPRLSVGGSHFLVDLLICCIKSKSTLKEVPVHYRKRVGESKITGSFKKAVSVGFNMLFLAVTQRLHSDI